jgi:glycosyltransferase involved in cell wall biosynthesis
MSTAPLRIAQVAPVATSIPPARSGSIQQITSLLTEGLVARGHEVTLFATGDSTTTARLHASFERGYWHDETMWPWELYEAFNLAAAVERGSEFDLVHYQALAYPLSLAFERLSATPLVHTIHHSPTAAEVELWRRYPEAPFVAVSRAQARLLTGLNVAATVLHGLDFSRFPLGEGEGGYLLFLGRFTEGKGAAQAIDVARRVGLPLRLAGAETPYYEQVIAPLVDGTSVIYCGEAEWGAKVDLYRGATALIYPVQTPEPFGLVLIEAMACGTPVAALDCGAVREIVDEDVTGRVFETLDDLVTGLPRAWALDRRLVRSGAEARFGADRMVDDYVSAYRRVIEERDRRARRPRR